MTNNKIKSYMMIKKFFIFLVVITFALDFRGFATVVSDNDGSAFITKAEFDSLKNTFQSQIDSYNVSIDNKIDSAIAQYLAGISVSSKTIKSLLLTDDDGYWFYGNRPEQTYAVPSINYIFSMQGAGHDSDWNRWPSAYGCTLIAKSSPAAMTKNLVTLADGKEEYGTTDANKWLWKGVNNTWKEYIQFAAQSYNSHKDVPWAQYMSGMSIYQAYDLTVPNGYTADTSNLWRTFTNSKLYYIYNYSGEQKVLLTGTLRNGFLDWSANYDDTATKKKIVCSIKDREWNAVCNTLTNTWYNDPEQTLTGKHIKDAASSSYDGSILKMAYDSAPTEGVKTTTGDHTLLIENHKNPGDLDGDVYSKSVGGDESTTLIPSVCSLGHIDSADLYMLVSKKTYEKGTIENVKLTDGIPLFYADKDIEVKLKFKVNSVTGGTGSGVSSTDEVDIVLGYGKFDNSGYNNTNGYVDSSDTKKRSTTIKWFTTSSKTKDINLTMEKGSWIYLKAKPHSLTQAQAEATPARVWNINFSTEDEYGKVTFVKNT